MSTESVPESRSPRIGSHANSSDARCPFCAEMVATSWCRTRDEAGTSYHVCMCEACGTAFLWPAPGEAELIRAYASDYYGAGETKFNPIVERFRNCFSKSRARHLTRGLKAGARILDVGCGDGRLLRNFQQAGRYELHGIELPGRAAERAGRIPGMQLHIGTLEAAGLPDAFFDLVTLVHVFEHLPAPRATLDHLANLMRPGGRLFLAFPNITSWQAALTEATGFTSTRHGICPCSSRMVVASP